MNALYRNNANLVARRRQPGWPLQFSTGPSGSVGTGVITITTPVSYQVFQRGAGGQGTISVTGTYTGSPGAMEASFNGGSWARLSDPPTGGTFSGTIANQTAGQGTLSVRWIGNPSSAVDRTIVGIGDIFIVGGQSNACGMSDSFNTYSHATLKAALFGNDYTWKELTEDSAHPFDDEVSQVDAVSSDAGTGGSIYPLLATSYMASQGIPCAFVPCPKVGSQITTDWAIGANHQDRTTLYGSMVYRTLQIGGARCVIWWQGESDAVAGTSQAAYNAALDTLADTFYSDTGVKIMACTLEAMNDAPWNFPTQRTAINSAITTAWGDNANVLTGADLSAFDFNGIHYGSADAAGVASAWWTAIRTAFGWAA